MSNCTLKVKDPTLKYFLGSDSFDSYQTFRNHFVNKVGEGIIPIGNVLESVSLNINGGYTVGDYTFDTIDSLINNSLGGLLETENPDIQFNKFLQTFEIFKVKYESEPYISNKDKEEDSAFISSLIEFYENYPVSDEFKQSNLYGDFLSGVAELKDLLLNQQLDNEEEPHYPTNESELYESSQENKPYIYTKTVVYDSTTKPVLDGKDELSIVRHNFNAEIERLIGEGRQFFIRLEKDGATNVQTITQDELSQKNISWGVIGVVYELVSGEFKRVYIQDYSPEFGGDVQITTDVKKAKSLGKNDVKGFTLTIPNMNEPWYSAVNPDVREAFISIRESISETNPSPFYKINEVWKEYPVATKWNKVNNERVKRESRVVTLREFLNEQKGELRISSKTEGINYAGNLYVQFPKGRAVLDRKPLNNKWKERVYNLVNHTYLPEENIQDVVDSLNRLLEFKGGDVSFSKRGNRIVVRRKSKRTKINDTWIYQRIKEEIKLEELFDLLDYARINVDKSYLENSDGLFPIVTEKGIKLSKVNWYDFYLDHHETIARQIKIKDKYYFEPIKSLVFNLESAQMQKIKKEQEQLKNPKLGDIELSPDTPIDTTTIINALQSIVNQVDGSTKDILSILKALLDNNEVKLRLEDSVVTFSTKEGDKFKGVSRNKTIVINWNLIQNPNLLGQVLAEEIVHTLTADWLTNNSQDNLSLELDELVKLAPQGILDKFGYSNNDPRFKLELLGKLGDPEVAKQLQGVKTKDKSLYDRIVDIIKEILDQVFGLEQFKKGNPTLYKELIVKLVEISTKQPQPKKVQPKDEWEGFDLNNLEFDLGPLGYDQSSLDSVLQNEKPSFLKELIKSLDADLFQYIYAKEKIGEFVTGELDFTTAFKELFNNYVAYVKLNRDNINEDEKKFYKFLFQNRDLVLNYWLENTESLKVRKPKKGEQDPSAKDISVDEDENLEPIDSNEPNDPTEIGENEKEEREQELSEINGGEEVNSNDKFFERTGTELSSLESADKLARIFVKMIPKIERNEEGTKIYSQEDVDKSTHPDWFVKIGDNRFVKYSTNVLGRPELCDYTSTWNSIAMTLADKLSLEEMLTYIDNHPELVNNIPEIFIFRERLRKEIKNTFDFELYSKIETSFKRAFVGVFVVLEKDGIVSLINESADIVNPAKRMFNSALVNSIQDKLSKYYIPESGKFKAKEWLKDIGVLKENEPNLTGRVLLKEMGLFLHPNTIWIDGNSKGNKTPEYQDFENQMVLFLKEFEEVPVTIADFLIKGTKNVEGLNNWFKKLFELEHKNRALSTTTMVTNAEGEKQSVLSVFNSILQYRKHYNDSQTLEQLNQLIPRTKNDMFEYSLTKSILFPEIADEDGKVQTIRSDRKVLVDIFSGWKKVEKGKASQGNLTIDLPDGDWIRLNFIGMLKQGVIENTRAETASTSYTFRLSSWDSSVKKMTPFSFADIDSQWNRENNQINISTSSNIFRVWNNYLKGELTRIQKQLSQGKLPKDIKFGLFKNILSDVEQKQLLNELTTSNVDQVALTNQELVLNALNRFFQSEIKQYSKLFETEMGGIKSIIGKNVSDLEGNESRWTGDNVIRNQIYGKYVNGKHEKDLLNQYKAFFVLNSLTLHTEETVLFQGDLSETPKYFKRAKGVQSTGTPLSKSQQLVDWVNSELGKYSFANLIGKGFSIGDKYQSATIVDDVKSSYYYDKGLLKEGFILSKKRANELSGIQQSESEIVKEAETLLESYSKTNIGDGDGFILADMYFALLQLVGNITQEQIIGHKALVLDAKKNASKYGLGKDQVLTEEEEKLRQEGLELLSEGKVIFPKLKVTHRGNAEGSVIQKEIMDKFALFPLYPQFVYDKPAAKAAMLGMMQEGIGYIKFESGTKIDNAGKTDLLQQIESGQTEISFQDSVHSLQTEYLREQIKTPHKVKEKNTFGTQFRKLITAIQDINLRKKWEELNQKFSSFTKKEILGELGITETEGKWNFSNVNKAKVAQVLLKEAKRRSLPENIRSFFDKYRRAQLGEQELVGVYDYLESSFGAQQIQSLLAGLIKKISIQKLKGAQLVQVSQSLFDRQITVEGKTRELGFYHFKGDSVQAAECKVAMQGDFKNLLNLKEVTDLLNKEKLEDNELTRTQVLNKLLQSDEWIEAHKDVLTTIGYRIPTQGFNSMEVMVIREFLPSFHGNTIVCPPEITTQSGTDYDYDKLSIIFPSIGKNGKLDNKGSKGVQNEMIKTASDILLAPENYYKLITPNSNDLIFGALKGENGLLSKLGISTEDPKFTKIITFLGNLFKFRAVKGKNLLGIAAVWNPFTVLIQNHKWTLNSNYNKVIGFGKKAVTVNIGVNPVLGGSLESYQPNTQDGTSKLEIISQLINVTVDMPSDDTFGQTVFSKDDFGALTYAISMLGYNLNDSLYFFHQPIIYKFKSEYQKNLKKGLSKNLAKLQAVSDLLGIPIPTGERGLNYTDFEIELYDKLTELESKLNKEKINKIVPIEEAVSSDYSRYQESEQQKAVLSHYIKLLDQASQIRTIQSALNFDTSPDNNLQKTFQRSSNYKQGVESGIINKDSIDEIKNDSVISGLYVSDILESLADVLFPIQYGGDTKLMYSQVSENFMKHKDRAYQQVTNDFLLSIVQNFGRYVDDNVDKSLYEIAEQYLIGDKKTNLIRRAKEIKEKFNKEGISYRLLDVIVLDLSKDRYPPVFNPQIFMGLENSPEDKDQIAQELREMITSDDPKISNFAKILSIVGLIQSGWSKSPVYFSDMLPEEFVTPLINNALQEYTRLSTEQQEEYKKLFVTKFINSRGGTLGKKNNDFITYLKEPHRLIDYRTDIQNIVKSSEVQEDISSIGTLPMQPDNIEMIKSGRKIQTIRTTKLEDGVYTLPDGTKVELSNIYGGTIKVKDLENFDKDRFAYDEGFKNWEDFIKNNKFSAKFISGEESRYVYSIKLASLNNISTIDISQFVNHSGGALGADSAWDEIGKKFGVTNQRHYYFKDKTPKGNIEITQDQFDEGIKKANSAAKATYGFQYSFSDNKVGRLLSRNWQQVKNSDAVFAIGKIVQKGDKLFDDDRIALKPAVSGGTGYAVEMAIQENKPVYVFDQNKNQWFSWNGSDFVQIETPTLTKNFAGIGTREINEQGKQAIRDVYQKTLEQGVQEVQLKVVSVAKPENIWSGSNDPFAAALTNPTTIAKRKGKINKEYPVIFNGKTYVDAEAAYKSNKVNDLELAKQGKIDPRNNQLMIEILVAKLNQYPKLVEELTNRGGVQWLEQSEHTVNGNRFEGKGRNSPFIQNLISAYEQVTSNKQTDNQLIKEYIDKVSTGQIVPDWFKRKVPVNFDRIREHQSISNLVQSIKNRIAEFNQKIEQYEREGIDQKVIDNVNNQILGYGSLVYDLENLRTQLGQQTLFGYDVESIEEFNRKKCTNI